MPLSPAKSFEDLIVWQKAHAFVLHAYEFSATFPRSEAFGLAPQLRRAAVSVSANIVEGFRRRGLPDKVRFLNIAEASVEEATYYLILAKDLSYGDRPDLRAELDEVSRMLGAYARAIQSRNRTRNPEPLLAPSS